MPNSQPSFASRNRFRWTDADAYLFDIDGTLLNTRDLVHYNALNRAMLEVYGVDTTIDGIAYHGKTDLGILRAALERVGIAGPAFEAKLPQALAKVREQVAQYAHEMNPEVCSAIPDVLRYLANAGKLLGVASGNLESVGWHKIAAAGLRRYFSFGCFSDQHELRTDVFARAAKLVREKLGAPASICFVGDTPEDIHAARQTGSQVIAVCTGVYQACDLESLEPDLCVASCAELLQTATL